MNSIHGHNHTWVIIQDDDRIGRFEYLLIVRGQFIWTIWNFFKEKCLELETEKAYAQAIGMLIDFMFARGNEFVDVIKRSDFFHAFAGAVWNGTVRDGTDPSGLWWFHRSRRRATKLLRCVCELSDWLTEIHNGTNINPVVRAASLTEQITFWRRWNTKKATALLGHLSNSSNAKEKSKFTRRSSFPRNQSKILKDPPAFPKDRLAQLLSAGYATSGVSRFEPIWKRFNIRDILVTLLLHFGGLRISEVFQIWVCDVFVDIDSKSSIVIVLDPSDGIIEAADPITGGKQKMTRAAYLRTRFNLSPLTFLTGKRHVGWKNPLLTEHEQNGFRVHWNSKRASKLFLVLYRIYLLHVRSMNLSHPFLFVTKDGQPMNPEAFRRIHRKAVRKIGLTPSKGLGTTPHGHRHNYGQYGRECGLSNKILMVAMHHASPTSQEVYTGPTLAEVDNAMRGIPDAAEGLDFSTFSK
ncbi:gamma-mobile-trio recombinase GmtY [Paraburkholderia sp. EG286B]|uniref:gamma-mobile-trio recombinase GmtY n=1 Tax=Paraburkholderia sp. EG286B TaxID=3237011 RepID=UPI0034D18252